MQRTITLHEKTLEYAAFASMLGGFFTLPSLFMPLLSYIVLSFTLFMGILGLRSEKRSYAITGISVLPVAIIVFFFWLSLIEKRI